MEKREKKFQINLHLSNRALYSLITLFIFAIVAVGVYALASGIDTTKGYHDSNQVSITLSDGVTQETLQQAIDNGDLSGGSGTSLNAGTTIDLDVGRGILKLESNANDNIDGAGVTLRTLSNPTDSGGSIFAVRSSGQAPRLWVGQRITSTGSNDFYVGTDTNGISNPHIRLNADGTATFNGDITAHGFIYSSDKRLKTNIQPLQDSLANVEKLQGVSFNWISNGQPTIGLIAQDVEKVYPELVSTNPDTGYKAVDYGKLVAILIEAVKSQQTEIDSLQKQIEELKK